MKTPRQILFDQHRQADEELDRIQAQVLSLGLPTPASPASAPIDHIDVGWTLLVGRKLWLEVLLPARRIWAGFAVVWLAIIVVNLANPDRTSGSAQSKTMPAGVLMAWKEQRKEVAELVNPITPRAVDRPEPVAPQPRSDRHPGWLMG